MSRIRWWLFLALAPFFGAGCGGGGGGSSVVTTPLPQALAITAAAPEVGVEQPFTSNLGAPPPGLTLSWDFGDGSPGSTAAASTHRYTTAGDYTVRLSVTNEAGQSVTAERSVSPRRLAFIRGTICGGANQSGWCASPAAFIDIEDPKFFGASTVFRRSATSWVGSDDAGRTFTPRMPAPDATLLSVYAADANNAWMVWKDAVGSRKLARTSNGGRVWTTLRTLPPPAEAEYGLKGTGQNVLLYQAPPETCRVGVGWNLCLSRNNELSVDGGTTWAVLPTPSTGFVGFNVNNVQITPSGSLAWLDCYSTMGGSCFRFSALRVFAVGSGMFAIPSQFQSGSTSAGPQAQRGDTLVQYDFPFGTNDLVLWRSSDGGRNWTTKVLNPAGIGLPTQTSWDGFQILERRCGSSVCELLEISAGASRYISIDGGSSWAPAPSLPFAVRRLDLLGDVLFDTEGSRLSVDAGATWRPLPVSPIRPSNDRLVQTDSGRFWLIHARPAAAVQYYQSLDGGRTWSLNYERKTSADTALGRVWMFGDGRVVSLAGTNIFESRDLAVGWDLVGSDAPAVDRLSFFDAASGTATSARGFVGQSDASLSRSTDGGRTWTTQAYPSWKAQVFPSEGVNLVYVSDLQALSDGTLWLAGGRQGPQFGVGFADYAAWRLTPGAATWERIGTTAQVPGPGRLQMVNATRGYLLIGYFGLGLQRTDDGGRTWTTLPLPAESPTLNAIYFINADVGWLVGDAGRILHTRDGGTSWTEQTSGSSFNFDQVGALDPYTVWVVGRDASFNRTLLLSATGGR